jgi:hypothetical protein
MLLLFQGASQSVSRQTVSLRGWPRFYPAHQSFYSVWQSYILTDPGVLSDGTTT